MGIAKPPLTIEKIKSCLNMLEYYRLTDIISYEKIKQYQNKDSQYVAFCKRHIAANAVHRNNVLKLLDYCETDVDRDLLRRRYVDRQDYYDIAYDLAYSESGIFKMYKKALEKLSENTKNMQEFEY